ncbi:MAG: nucleotidyl transferase AbiEii/AbiGii toxin family protein [Phycisphaerae bacterium]|mgnify:CR=1 FL=1|nr:nucleotidyl transferase AbiEii/AbiGii toxin family protein [Phycisphaerae bacterium]
MAESTGPTLHEDVPLFCEAVNFTASKTGFNPRLIEKDYFGTVLLAYLAECGIGRLVFKGGTCLAKVHAGFYRLSEDLDFTIPLPVEASRKQCSQAVAPAKKAVSSVAGFVAAMKCTEPLTGANNSTQYIGVITYESRTTGQREPIQVEISVREPLLLPTVTGQARTLLLDPIGGNTMIPAVAVGCIDVIEAMAEKFRAALSRQDVAIRDFYDIDYAAKHLGLDMISDRMIDLVRQKLAVPGNLPVDVGEQRLADLKRQLDARLKTVLRERDFRSFDLDQAIRLAAAMAESVRR